MKSKGARREHVSMVGAGKVERARYIQREREREREQGRWIIGLRE